MASQAGAQAAKALNPAFNPRTVHFWAPMLKWSIVIAGISDFYRPVEQLSVSQNMAITATGAIWTRWCMIVRPQNIPLAAVNFFMCGVGTVQLTRLFMHHQELKKESKVESIGSKIVEQLPPKAV